MYLFDISRICKTFTSTYKEICRQRVQRKTIKTQIERADHLKRSSLLNKPQSQKKLCIPLKYNPMLPNLEKIIGKHWNILNINPDYRETFKILPIIAFRKKNFLKQVICTNIIRNNKKYLNPALHKICENTDFH